MARQIEITVNGKGYPCRMTMGAMLRFKRETDREVTDVAEGNLSDVVTLLWCCVQSACHADGVEFPLDLLTFADQVSAEEALAWVEAIQGEQAAEGEGEKKSL